jgi:hypothetical protein
MASFSLIFMVLGCAALIVVGTVAAYFIIRDREKDE